MAAAGYHKDLVVTEGICPIHGEGRLCGFISSRGENDHIVCHVFIAARGIREGVQEFHVQHVAIAPGIRIDRCGQVGSAPAERRVEVAVIRPGIPFLLGGADGGRIGVGPPVRSADTRSRGIAADVIPGFVAGKNEVYPIPQTELDLNPNLSQNLGY